jgi:hypothetical protein
MFAWVLLFLFTFVGCGAGRYYAVFKMEMTKEDDVIVMQVAFGVVTCTIYQLIMFLVFGYGFSLLGVGILLSFVIGTQT